MLMLEVGVLLFALYRFDLYPSFTSSSRSGNTPPPALTSRDVLPTPTPDASIPPRLIVFPQASVSAPIIPAGRVQGTWETRHLGDSVGHLVGTSWFDDPGGNIVLAGHVENAAGQPGPFAHLFEAEVGDEVILRDGTREEHYRVTEIKEVAPDEVSYVAQDGRRRVTLITCTDWDFDAHTYLGRLVVIAEPVVATAQN
jgi:LPXTG-site transpeptidase (sortase) family protein